MDNVRQTNRFRSSGTSTCHVLPSSTSSSSYTSITSSRFYNSSFFFTGLNSKDENNSPVVQIAGNVGFNLTGMALRIVLCIVYCVLYIVLTWHIVSFSIHLDNIRYCKDRLKIFYNFCLFYIQNKINQNYVHLSLKQTVLCFI